MSVNLFMSRHAGTYVAEEVMRIMRDKLILLQKLYINQFKRLRYVMTEDRRAYRLEVFWLCLPIFTAFKRDCSLN